MKTKDISLFDKVRLFFITNHKKNDIKYRLMEKNLLEDAKKREATIPLKNQFKGERSHERH